MWVNLMKVEGGGGRRGGQGGAVLTTGNVAEWVACIADSFSEFLWHRTSSAVVPLMALLLIFAFLLVVLCLKSPPNTPATQAT